MYTELLKLFDMEDSDIEEERPRIDKAFAKAGIGPDDCKTAVERVKRYYDLDLTGMRIIYRIWLMEFVDMVLAREEGKKIVYGVYPTFPTATEAVLTASEDYYIVSPEVIVCVVMGQMFDKIGTVLEEAERSGLEPGRANCSLLQARLGAIAKGIIPVPDVLLCTRFFCDQVMGVDELIHQEYGANVVYTDTCHGAMQWSEWPEIEERKIRYLGTTLTRSLNEIAEITGIEISDDDMLDGVAGVLGQLMSFNIIADMLREADPVPVSFIDHWNYFLAVASTMRRCSKDNAMDKAGNKLCDEIEERVDNGEGITEKGAPRILVNISSFVDPTVTYMLERDFGLGIPMSSYGWLTDNELDELSEHSADYEYTAPISMMGKGIFHSSSAFIDYHYQLAQIFNCDGFFWAYPFSCQALCMGGLMAKKKMEERGMPVLSVEYDYYDPRTYTAENLRTRTETFANMLRRKKAK